MTTTNIEKPFYDELLNGETIKWNPKKLKTLSAESVKITAPEARYILANYNSCNRKPSSVIVTKYATDMMNKKWAKTGQTISFSTDGTLLDGQHRLLAVAKSGIPQEFLVSYGSANEVFSVIDNGKSRTTTDILGLLNHSEPAILGALVRMIIAYELNGSWEAKNFKGANQITKSQTLDYIDNHPEVINFVERYKKCNIVSSSITSFVYWLFSGINSKDAEKYLDMVLLGYGLKPNTLESYLFSKLQRNRNAIQNKMTKNAVIANIIMGWNRFRGHSNSKAIQINWKPENGLPKPH